MVLLIGLFFVITIFLAFTDIPFYAYHRLGTANSQSEGDPDLIVLLAGNSMPSPDGLLKAYYASIMANEHPSSQVIVAMPHDTALKDCKTCSIMIGELTLRGVDSNRITMEGKGVNTKWQAVHIGNRFSDEEKLDLHVRIITSPEHMYRSVAVFKKEGFKNVDGMSTFGKPLAEEDLKETSDENFDGTNNLNIRYNLWTYMHYELLVAREFCAIAYYKLKGWL